MGLLADDVGKDVNVAAAVYEIVVKGELGPTVASAFEGMRLECHSGQTAIVGYVEDQAQLNGLLRRVADLGLDLVSVGQVGSGDPAPSTPNGRPS
jgi:hypothetical protein